MLDIYELKTKKLPHPQTTLQPQQAHILRAQSRRHVNSKQSSLGSRNTYALPYDTNAPSHIRPAGKCTSNVQYEDTNSIIWKTYAALCQSNGEPPFPLHCAKTPPGRTALPMTKKPHERASEHTTITLLDGRRMRL